MKIINYYKKGIIFIIKFPFLFLKYFVIGLLTIITIIPYYLIIGLKYIIKKQKPQEKDILENKFIPITIITLSLATYLISIFILTRWFVQSERTKKFADSFNNINSMISQEDITKDTPNQYEDLTNSIQTSNDEQNLDMNYINVNLNYYISKNPETVAWIQVNGTNINYPVVQHKDNNYYLEHDFYKRKTDIGWIFGDYRNDFKTFNNNTIIYGHNIINRTMFGSLPFLLKKDWFTNQNKQYIKLSTKNTNSIWQIFSVYKTTPTTDYLQAKFNSTEIYQTFLDNLKKKSQQKFDVEVTNTDKIITLSTCDDTGTKRVAVHAKLIKIENK